MALTLTWPVGHDTDRTRTRQTAPRLGPVAAYTLSSAIGGALVGAGIAQLGAAVRDVGSAAVAALTIVVAGVVVVAVVLEWEGRLSPLPERRAQVPRHWLLWRHRTLTGAAFGLVIGAGVFTHLRHAAAYALAAVAVLAPSVTVGALIGATYGLSRGLTLSVTWVGDRFLGRRPRWPETGALAIAARRLLAATAALSFLAALLLAT